MSVDALPNPILQAPEPFEAPAPAVSWRWLHVAVGQEMFGRRAGPWGIVFAPIPLTALALGLAALFTPGNLLDPWLASRFGELAWIGLLPFLLAASVQAIAMAISDFIWRLGEGACHVDYSPRVWHYHLGLAIAVLPLVLLQVSDGFLDLYLRAGLAIHTLMGTMKVPIAGYDPGFAHLLVLGALPAIHWQVRRVVVKIPCGRLWGFQRELARLRGIVTWQPDAWAAAVGDTFDQWLEDIAPRELEEQPITSERARQHRLRWAALRKEVIECWRQTPPDLPRANRALRLYREGW